MRKRSSEGAEPVSPPAGSIPEHEDGLCSNYPNCTFAVAVEVLAAGEIGTPLYPFQLFVFNHPPTPSTSSAFQRIML